LIHKYTKIFPQKYAKSFENFSHLSHIFFLRRVATYFLQSMSSLFT